jgi:hypothetical protein
MKRYRDTEGAIVFAYQVDGPIILNTVQGERCGSAGSYVVLLDEEKTAILPEQEFIASFTEVIEE